ncbi:hypothetical protein E6P70_09435 [Moraxella nonliquefaciens]|uniref:hypothetical protein n=1 Tax=Moraxella nonliquefaciens TaxID=478 RepID=UPI0024A6BB22|nr:hypothetical protein [Moraxella nonliquefaciens]MDI4500807.1 hypothetical protein [Moraxella nonliquefaciens]
MRLSKFVKTYQDEIPYYLGVATAVFLAWLAYWAVTTPKPHERRSQKTEPIIQAYVDKHGATNRFLCDNGIYVKERIDDYGQITRQVMVNQDLTVKSALRCSDNVSIKTNEMVGGGL